MKNFMFRLQAMCIALLLGVATMSAQEIRYVKENGAGSKNGSSWAHAYANVQDAINDLVNNNLTGEVWVAAGHYYPTETTEASNSPYYKSFKIPAGITVRGGFRDDLAGQSKEGVNTTDTRPLKDDKNFGKAGVNDGFLDGEGAKSGKYLYETILHGDLTGRNATFTWNDKKNQFDATFYGNSYHVVWFAMNGFSGGRANPLVRPAKLEGCVVEGGNALATTTTAPHPHIAYGGGIYMVANSFVYNCEVRNCEASRNGGGIYMDGGGIVRRTYVHHCQALGLGTEFGLGGGICEDGAAHNSKTNPIVVAQSVVTNCVGRIGGGMALSGADTQDNNKYAVVANSTLVNNNTAQVEAGGVYTYAGGALASMTIVRNKCYGTGVMQNDVVTGRSGGVYSRDAAYIANSVLWGNECSSNNDVQYATSQSSLNNPEKSKFYYNALSKADNTDWSNSTKMGLASLSDSNESTGGTSSKGFPLFFKPTTTAGYLEAYDDNDITPADDTPEKKATKMAQWPNWQVSSESFLSYAGIATVDLDYEGLTPAPQGKSWDMQFGEFNSRPTIGALISQVSDIAPAQNVTYEGVNYDFAFFVDPDFIYAGDNTGDNGTDWEHPARFLGSILDFIAEPKKSHTFDTAPVFTDKKVAIFVKQGTVDNTRIGGDSRVRVTKLDIPSNVSLFGSFNGHLIGTDLSLQNVVHTPTVISGQLMDKYDLNVAHLISIKNKHDIHIEGFKISYANASSTKLDNTDKNGAAITVVGSEDITFRNILVSNCTADNGAAVYADKSTVRFENCIFHNNHSANIANSGIVYGVNGSALDFDHCDVLRNVGHASYLDGATTNHWQNSIFYGNLDRPVSDTNVDSGSKDPSNEGLNTYALAAFSGTTANATGAYCMFDARSASFSEKFGGNDTGNQWQYNLQYKFADGTGKGYPRFINPTKNSGVTEDGDQTYYGRATSFEPHNNNPIVNMASHADIHTSWGRDLVDVTRDFGGLPDIGAVENHEANQFEEGENAYADGQKAYGDAYYVRDYSTNGTGLLAYATNQGSKGGTLSPVPNGIYNAAGELLDGASWEYAVNGNGLYTREAIVSKSVNTVVKTTLTHVSPQFAGTFTIHATAGNETRYIYINNSNVPALTTDASQATHFEVEDITTETMVAGTRYIKGNNRYLYRSSGNNSTVSTTTNSSNKIVLTGSDGVFRLAANGRYYYINSSWSLRGTTYSLSLTQTQSSGTAWTFTPDKTSETYTGTETPLKQDGTAYEGAKKSPGVSRNAELKDPLNFHVYKSLEDYNNAVKATNINAVTYKIKRNATNNALKNTANTNYLYPTNATADGDDFILIQDGEYGKYYIYDVTTSKYLYYYSGGSAGTSRVRAGADANKTTWWVDANGGALNIVYGGQPWTTDGNYAISCAQYQSRNNPVVTVAQKGTDNANLVLVANEAYDVYNYTESGKAQETLNGLQYAVNLANEKFVLDNKAREVKVGKGIYTNATPKDQNSVEQPYAYMIKEGVNVYGGFPENGNPGMNERQPKTFITVLQPQSGNPFITMTHGIYSGSGQDAKYAFVPTSWGANANATDDYEQASVGRVLVQPTDFTVETAWDGFTLQHGYLFTARMHNIAAAIMNLNTTDVKTAGGAGALLQNKGILTNCEVKDNLLLCYPGSTATMTKTGADVSEPTGSLYTFILGGAGVFMTGANAVVENSQIYNNQLLTKAYLRSDKVPDNLWLLGGGLYQDNGQVYNTIIHDNVAAAIKGSGYSSSDTGTKPNNEMVLGGGAFIANGNFYNNTIVNNQSATIYHCHTNHCTFAGVHVKDEARIYNSIIADNTSHWGYEGYYSDPNHENNPGKGVPVSAFQDEGATRDSRDNTKVHVKYSFVDVNRGANKVDLVSWNDMPLSDGATEEEKAKHDAGPYNTNVYLNIAQGGASKTITTDSVYHKLGATGTTADNIYHIFAKSPAFNSGTEAVKDKSGNAVTIPDYDAEYTDRIKDCAIDMGAYEFNGAAAVKPTVTGEQAVFYVTHNGFGTRTGKNATNAACAAKLQIVLDAAGRYKYLNPTKQVIVKVANDKAMQDANSDFTYYATRTTDQTDQDVRVWSIMVPRGVEVWGGYTDVPMKKVDGKVVKDTNGEHNWGETYNGFYSGTTDLRDIIVNPTYFDSHYVNKLEKTEANTYHVVTFTDRIFDQNGLAYTKEDFKGKDATQVAEILSTGAPSTYIELPGSDESLFAHMSESFGGYTGISGNVIMDGENPKQIDGKYASNRAVIDGIFVSGGQADASTNSTSSTVNINSYGGAALVNEFAYVRNCILVGNTATNGGALALTDRALVTGCLIMENEAQYNGGGIYVFEDGTKLSDGRVIDTKLKEGDIDVMDYRMSHVITSTIVNNNANEDGGGVWYTTDYNTNVRFNSVAIWNNTSKGQENVYGMVNPEQPTDDETTSELFYPFSYSIIQNIRASGTNNLNVTKENREGMRFVQRQHDVDKDNNLIYMANEKSSDANVSDFGFYGLTTYSMLSSAGMPKTFYNQLKSSMAIADNDLMGKTRVDDDADNLFVEVGARALAKRMPKKQLMLRLFVAHPENVDTEIATSFMELAEKASITPAEEYYAQEGSSFAYPFNSLQHALDYVKLARNGRITGNDASKNLPFEILVGKGEWYPKKSLNSETHNVWAATYAIPEGVTIIGGFNPQGGGSTYYGRYYEPKSSLETTKGSIYDNVTSIPKSNTVTPVAGKEEVGRGNNFGSEDVNGKTFQQWHIQDIADRRAMSDINKNGIVEPWEFTNQTIISGNAVNGETDGVYHIMTAVADAHAVGNMPMILENPKETFTEDGYHVKEVGQQIRLNGLVVTGGNALTYLSTALDDYGSYIFYQGAGLQVDGNRYSTSIDKNVQPVFHNSQAYGVGYRDIPVSITNCQFRNNKAGYGGAISTNGSLSIFGSSFEQNIALAQTETAEDGDNWTDINGNKITEVNYPGQGGAILATYQLSAFNTLFANNEARHNDTEHPATIGLFSHKSFRVPSGAAGTLRAAGGAIMMGSAANHHIVNCDFVRNKANAYPAVFTMNPTKQENDNFNTHKYSQIINTVAWGNEVNQISSDENYLRAAKLMVNIGKKDRAGAYDPTFNSTNIPSATVLANNNAESTDWQEAVWFCAYEDGVGFKPNNANDLREAISYTASKFAPTMIKDANVVEGVKTYQNCNISISADNMAVDGPSFGNPSMVAGYDGFTESADWSPSRFNKLTDNGNGWIKQTVTEISKKGSTKNDSIKVEFNNNEALGTGYQGAYSYTHYISEIDGNEGAFPEYKLWLAIGNEKYMQATNDPEKRTLTINGETIVQPQKNMPRISPDPTKGVKKAYIDIGVYEYIKPAIVLPGSEVDILWVSTKENPSEGPATGLTWKTPMSDLQRAIETLLSSRNGHKKEIRLMEGEYAPVTPKTVGGKKYNAFVIDTKSVNEGSITPSTFTGTNNDSYYAQSITIKGGYSSTIPYEYDPVTYKTTIRQKEAVDGSSTDYLIYIADPTVRYAYKETSPGVSGYTPGNNYGARVDGADDEQAKSVKTMPVQVDGVTLINDKAKEGTKGSAIYYPDYTETAPEANISGAHNVSAGGKVLYYETKADLEAHDHTKAVDHETEFAEITDEGAETVQNTKLLITKTEVIGSGKKGDTSANASAVYIGQKGGAALIYNSVFHSNYGMPLDAYNTINVNNTFGKNTGMVRLNNVADSDPIKSQMHNTALWKNNETSKDVYGAQVLFGSAVPTASDALFSYNSYTGGPITETNGNTALADDNSNIGEGPNFVDPENADVEARNYDIKPSIRLLNKGKDTSLEAIMEDAVDKNDGSYYTKVVKNKYDFSLASTTDVDILNRPRLKPNHIDIGAYEFQGSLYNVLYVDPNKTHSDEATGQNWDKAFGYGDLQDAVDLAAIYHASTPSEEAYVFVKGNSSTNTGKNTNETLTLRDGVTTYGSIISSYTDWHGDATHGGNILNYIKDMTSNREGVASNAASKTIVTGIKTDNDATYNGGITGQFPALVDGFVVTNPTATTTPVLDVTSQSESAVIVVRNVVVADNNVTGGANVAEISNGLIYEALFRDNQTTGAALKVSNYSVKENEVDVVKTRGFAANVTVEGKTIGADNSTPVDGEAGAEAEKAAQIFNSITNSIETGASASGAYGNIKNKGISGFFYNIADPNLNYQLTETSKYIDMCTSTNPLEGVEGAANLVQFINYKTDRDILGNPRLLAGVTEGKVVQGSNPEQKTYLDRGAFETWKVKNVLNGFLCGEEGTIKSIEPYKTNDDGKYSVIKKHFYPHDGSVVYIMENQSLVIDAWDPLHEVKPTPHNPGFMLVKEGANFYGNGRPATCAFIAIERKVREHGSIVAVPYAMKYNKGVDVPGLDGSDLKLTNTSGSAYEYSGSERSAWDYIFKDGKNGDVSMSKCWKPISDEDATAANTGVLYMPKSNLTFDTNNEVLLRFTAQGANLTDYLYTETTDAYKAVTLYQYDDAESTGNGADFTDNLDMGWNCFGIPYLVSDYKPYERVNTTNAATVVSPSGSEPYRMDSPHTLWLYYNGKYADGTDFNSEPEAGDGGYYSVKSWETSDNLSTANPWHVSTTAEQRLWMGEGIFTQTAVIGESESLAFYRPVTTQTFQYTSENRPSLAKRTNSRFYSVTGITEIEKDEPLPGEDPSGESINVVETKYYTVDGMQIERPRRGVVIIRQKLSNGQTRSIKRNYK